MSSLLGKSQISDRPAQNRPVPAFGGIQETEETDPLAFTVRRISDDESDNSNHKQRELNRALEERQAANLSDMYFLYSKSYAELELVFRTEFPKSSSYRDFVLLMNQNMVEYKFMRQAGVIQS